MENKTTYNAKIFKTHLKTAEFNRLGEFITQFLGIKVPPSKQLMIEGRLRKRLRTLGFDTYEEYCDYLFSKKGMEHELSFMVDVVTTHKTDFFREPDHFEILETQILPVLTSNHSPLPTIKIWSAGASTGKEAYSLGITLTEFKRKKRLDQLQTKIIATDISKDVLITAAKGVYSDETIQEIPQPLLKKYFLKSKDPGKHLIKVAPEIRKMVSFMVLNFMDTTFSIPKDLDMIFFRNVMIYFDRKTQYSILLKMLSHLKRKGHLFIGHSETLNGINLPIKQLYPTVYQKL